MCEQRSKCKDTATAVVFSIQLLFRLSFHFHTNICVISNDVGKSSSSSMDAGYDISHDGLQN
jgi:hypothetical protein